ncbi:FecR domain-containing protein [Leptolyngbya sp. FACHB-671]|uniref:FecR family protein n=1 Tax=Leptolyngbya sp. FACHB-671 TaxID=2692812 RepID=UPI001683ABE1|nr:FecR family protein [Leptolyngbya sp. FACHB-671]MBD2072251.1 FecR domain-containing protein [Leptolyngbya sp. FACHB-671]
MKKYWLPLGWLPLGLLLALSFPDAARQVDAQSLQVRVDRWLEVREATGTVTYQQGQNSRNARVGTRLQAVGETIRTGQGANAVLAVDTGIGFVNVSENTTLRVQSLEATNSGGRITQLQVLGGQARLQVRRLTNPDSRLEIQTPAGVSGVRGTDFGVSVQPDGKTGVVTLEGGVVASAQGESVAVNAGFQSLVIPGEPPSPAVPLRDDPGLDLRQLTAEPNRTARIAGQVDPVNLVQIENEPLVLDRQGNFDVTVPLPANRSIEAVVTTPLGKQQVYQLLIP